MDVMLVYPLFAYSFMTIKLFSFSLLIPIELRIVFLNGSNAACSAM